MTAPPLAASGLAFRRGGRLILNDVSLALASGRMTALLGPNGSGKTTLLRILLGLLRPHLGDVRLHGVPLRTLGRAAIAREIAYVPQQHVPVFPYPAIEVVALGRLPATLLQRGVADADRRIAHSCLERLGIAHLAHRPYTELSGGERQTVILARALAQGARILVLDEPAAGLDHGQRLRLRAISRSLANDGYTMLATTHDPVDLGARFDDAILLRDSRIMFAGDAGGVTDEMIRALYDLR